MKTWLQIACELGTLLEAETDDDHPKAPKDGLGEMQLENEIQSTLAELRLMLAKDQQRMAATIRKKMGRR